MGEIAGTIDINIQQNTGLLVFNNPGSHNALTQSMWRDLPLKIRQLENDKAVRIIIMRGAGERAFSAGADISEFDRVRKNAETARIYEAENIAAFAAIRECQKPVIAMINGYCIGGGFGIAAAADLRLADERAIFAVPAAKLGLAYPVEALADIIHSVGEQITREMLFTAKKYTAMEMQAHGFLLKTCQPGELAHDTQILADQIASNAPATIRASKLTIAGLRRGDLAKANIAADATFESLDYAEGRAAFRENRNPVFKNR